MDLINKIHWRFVSEREIISEDVYSLMNLFGHVACVGVLPEAMYYYCQNGTSLTRAYRKDRYQGIKVFYDKIMILCENHRYPEMIKTRFASAYFAFVIATLKLIALSEGKTLDKLSNIRAIEKDSHLKKVLSEIDLKIESKSRKFVRLILLKENTLLCYLVLLLKYKHN